MPKISIAMKKNTLFILLFNLLFLASYAQVKNQTKGTALKLVKKRELKLPIGVSSHEDCREEIALLRKKHQNFLNNSPFKKTLKMSEDERLESGIPPNKYFESEWELNMNPETGIPTFENIEIVRKELALARQNDLALGRVPGDAIDNMWIERGPTNVGGRTRGLLFDPNDTTKETVFAGGVSGGIWKNTNISNPNSVWSRVNIPENLSISSLIFDPNNTTTFYAGTGESYTSDVSGTGIWKSIDSGANWFKVLGGVSGPTIFQSNSSVVVNTPSSIAGSYVSLDSASFGTNVQSIMTSDLVLVNDGTATPSLGCSTLTNAAAINGKIALIRRGTCAFVIKAKAAQDAGAIAVIIMNNVDGTPQPLGGTDATITIPTLSISQSNGNTLETALLSGNVNVTLSPPTNVLTGNIVPGIQNINDIKIRNNAGVSEIYASVSDGAQYGASLGGNEYGLYKSSDSGSSWTQITLPLTTTGRKYCPNEIEIGANNKIWLATTESKAYRNGGGTLFSSIDGVNFVKKYEIPNGKRTQIAVSKITPDLVYVLAELDIAAVPATPVTILKTTDGFANVSTVGLPAGSSTDANDFTRGQAFYDLVLELDPSNEQIVYVGGIDLFKSVNGASTWSQFTDWTGSSFQNVHSDQHALTFAGAGSTKMVFGNDGGVYYSDNGGVNTSSRNTGYNVTQFYTVAVAPSNSGLTGDFFVAGAQDNGSAYFNNAPLSPSTSQQIQGGDGATCMFDQGTDKYYITNYVYNGNINSRTAPSGVSKNINTEPNNSANGAFIAVMALDSKTDMLFSDYTNTTGAQIRRYTNVKPSVATAPVKTILSNALMTAGPSAMTVSPFGTTTSTTLLIGTRNGKILRVTNANTTPSWSDIGVGFAFVGSVSDIEYGKGANQIFVTMSNYNVNNIWYTNDGGISWEVKDGNFPDIPVKCILNNPLSTSSTTAYPTEVMIGTELGVWFTNNFDDPTPTWRQSFNGMSNVKVTDLDLRIPDNTVFASTYGRGVFSGVLTNAILKNQSFENNIGIKVYPNPTSDILNVSVQGYVGELLVRVVDVNGREVFNQNIKDFSSEKAISLKGVQSGVYIMNLKGDNLQDSRKIILN